MRIVTWDGLWHGMWGQLQQHACFKPPCMCWRLHHCNDMHCCLCSTPSGAPAQAKRHLLDAQHMQLFEDWLQRMLRHAAEKQQHSAAARGRPSAAAAAAAGSAGGGDDLRGRGGVSPSRSGSSSPQSRMQPYEPQVHAMIKAALALIHEVLLVGLGWAGQMPCGVIQLRCSWHHAGER